MVESGCGDSKGVVRLVEFDREVCHRRAGVTSQRLIVGSRCEPKRSVKVLMCQDVVPAVVRHPACDLCHGGCSCEQGGAVDAASWVEQTRPDLKVVYTSGYTDNAIVHQGRLDPGVSLLQKPLTQTILAAKIREILDKG